MKTTRTYNQKEIVELIRHALVQRRKGFRPVKVNSVDLVITGEEIAVNVEVEDLPKGKDA